MQQRRHDNTLNHWLLLVQLLMKQHLSPEVLIHSWFAQGGKEAHAINIGSLGSRQLESGWRACGVRNFPQCDFGNVLCQSPAIPRLILWRSL